MGERIKKAAALLATILTAGMMSITALAAEEGDVVATSGTLGDNGGFQWTYDESTKTVTVTGEDSGFMGYRNPDLDHGYGGVIYGYRSPIYDIDRTVQHIILHDCKISGSMVGAFCALTRVQSIEFINVDTSEVTDMTAVFSGCEKLTSLDVSGLDTSNVTGMMSMFDWCLDMTELDISSFDTSNVTDMSYMFSACEELKSVDISGLNTTALTTIEGMFYGCESLENIDITGWDTSNVTSMKKTFDDCDSLTSLNLSNLDVSAVTDMSDMFSGCINLTSLNISGWDTSNVTNMSGMFGACGSLDLSDLDTANVTDMSRMFSGYRGTESLDLSTLNTSKVTDMHAMFSYCTNMESIDVSSLDTGKVTSTERMFDHCTSLKSLDISNFNTQNVTSMREMFEECSSLESLTTSAFDASKLWSMEEMFINCTALKSIKLSTVGTSRVESMYKMFIGCTALESVDLSGFDTSNVKTMGYMLRDCSNLQSLNLSGCDLSNVKYEPNMFGECDKLITFYTPSAFGCKENLPGMYRDLEGNSHYALNAAGCGTSLTRQKVELVPETTEMTVGSSQQLSIYIDGVLQDTSVNKYTYGWFDRAVATPSLDGVVTAHSMGIGRITCYLFANRDVTATCEILVRTPFSDIKVTDWQYPYVVYAYENNLMSGKGEGKFDMNGNLTRSEFVTVLYSHSEKPEVTFSDDFSDVASDDWFANAITWAKQEGISVGNPNGTFGVYDNITREQLVAMLYQYAIKNEVAEEGAATTDLTTYSDAGKVSTWAVDALEWAVENNIISGKVRDGVSYLEPQEKTTRGECATMMMRYVELAK